MTTDDRCFICGLRIGRGNQPSIGLHERMNKLVSVSQTVEHSSTIISDILSRILNETVMHEETICRICFNLLNDIDYHLKEAQEKTDEITNKFLDKGKDPLSYNPQPIVMAAAGPDEDMLETEDDEGEETVVTVASGASARRFPARKEQQASSSRHSRRSTSRKKKSSVGSSSGYALGGHDTDAPLTEDEMSVNIINKNKAKLLTHVLNPRMKVKHDSRDGGNSQKFQQEEEVDDEDEEEDEEDDEEYYEPKLRKRRKGGSGGRRPMRQQSKRHSDSRQKSSAELETVNMEDLGDISSSKQQSSRTVYFAKKSEPPPSAALAKSLAGGGSSKGDDAVSCELCHKMFKKRTNLQLHMEKVHVSQAPVFAVVSVDIPETHKCNLCPREFTNEKSLIAHRGEHNLGLIDPPTQHAPRAKVAKPSSSAEEGEVKATCPQCNKTFRRQFNMRIHIDRVHNKVRPFPCKFCDKSFATNSDLKQHMTVHGEGKKFACEECGRIFTNRDSIILHRKQHSNQRSHFCQVCNKGFFKASCLNRHFRTHTGDRPYKCDYCRKGFSQSTTLKIHKEKCPKNPQHQQKGKERTILGV